MKHDTNQYNQKKNVETKQNNTQRVKPQQTRMLTHDVGKRKTKTSVRSTKQNTY